MSSYRLTGGAQRPSASGARGGPICWIHVLLDGTLAYATGAAVVVGFAVGPDGQLDPLTTDAVVGRTPDGSMLLDLDASRGGRFLYVLGAPPAPSRPSA